MAFIDTSCSTDQRGGNDDDDDGSAGGNDDDDDGAAGGNDDDDGAAGGNDDDDGATGGNDDDDDGAGSGRTGSGSLSLGGAYGPFTIERLLVLTTADVNGPTQDASLAGVSSTTITLLDADVAPGPVLRTGSTVTWTYVVTNTGQIPLTNVSIVDDEGTPNDPSDDITFTFLTDPLLANIAPGESVTVSASAIVVDGPHSNLATVQTDEQVSDSDPAQFVGQESKDKAKKDKKVQAKKPRADDDDDQGRRDDDDQDDQDDQDEKDLDEQHEQDNKDLDEQHEQDKKDLDEQQRQDKRDLDKREKRERTTTTTTTMTTTRATATGSSGRTRGTSTGNRGRTRGTSTSSTGRTRRTPTSSTGRTGRTSRTGMTTTTTRPMMVSSPPCSPFSYRASGSIGAVSFARSEGYPAS